MTVPSRTITSRQLSQVDSINVKIIGFEVTGDLETTFDSFANLTLVDTLIYGQVFNTTLSCDDVVNPPETIGAAVTAAGSGNIICVGYGTYN